MPGPIDTRKQPKEVKIHVSDGTGLDILWADGHRSHFDFVYLRENCPCAMCNDERIKKMAAPIQPEAAPIDSPFPMFKPRTAARAAKSIGNYALQIDFTDGHGSGIYSFDYLRTICPCPECAKTFRFSSGDFVIS